MSKIHSIASSLRRPKLLVRAARHGLADYNRRRDLGRLTGQNPRSRSSTIVENLIAQEQQLEAGRQSGDRTYRVAKHIELLVALMAECRLLPKPA